MPVTPMSKSIKTSLPTTSKTKKSIAAAIAASKSYKKGGRHSKHDLLNL